jgi:hypothetical protein
MACVMRSYRVIAVLIAVISGWSRSYWTALSVAAAHQRSRRRFRARVDARTD